MEEYLQKAKVFNQFFGVFGKGNFDISEEELARIIELLITKNKIEYLEVNLQELYERLYKTRMG